MSSSMAPWLQPGEEVLAICCQLDELKPLDIILVWRQKTLICHILLKIDQNFIFTSSLNGLITDPPVHVQHYLARVEKPKFKFIQKTILRWKLKNVL